MTSSTLAAPIAAVTLGPRGLSADELIAVARHDARIEISPEALARVAHGAAVIESLAADPMPHYGVSTGFGALATVSIPAEKRAQLQLSLVRSHAASTGAPVEREVVRALMASRLANLASGHTGVRPLVVQAYADLLNSGITPLVREYGSLGCSGDLAPLAHCALALLGEGDVTAPSGAVVPAAQALADAGLKPISLREKEGLALINGTDGMLGMLTLALDDIAGLLQLADVTAALSLEALRGNADVFAPDLQRLRPHRGQAASAANIYAALSDSQIVATARTGGFTRVQDAYSLRCAPQVHGAARDARDYAASVADVERHSVIDNPVLTDDDRLESNGNFHGAPLAYAADFLAIVLADVASISERRTDRLLDRARSGGLPPFLAADPGTDSGYMIAQYTQAGIVSELKRLAVPASVDSIPTSAMQEDHVSMGWAAARKLRRSVDGLRRVLSIEAIAAARGIGLREQAPGSMAQAVLGALREQVPGIGPDEYVSRHIEAATALAESGRLLAAARTGLARTGHELG